MSVQVPAVAGLVSTTIFVASVLPMLVKAARTKDMASYSIGQIGLANLGNLVHSLYVFSLPAGPIWVLHGFYLVSTGWMLLWWLRYRDNKPGTIGSASPAPTVHGEDGQGLDTRRGSRRECRSTSRERCSVAHR